MHYLDDTETLTSSTVKNSSNHFKYLSQSIQSDNPMTRPKITFPGIPYIYHIIIAGVIDEESKSCLADEAPEEVSSHVKYTWY